MKRLLLAIVWNAAYPVYSAFQPQAIAVQRFEGDDSALPDNSIQPAPSELTAEEQASNEIYKDIIKVSVDIAAKNGFVFMIFLNHAYLTMTKSWVCNLRQIREAGVVEHTLFVVTQNMTRDALLEFDPSLNVYVQYYNDPGDVRFGTPAYFRLLVERMYLQRVLLKHGVNTFTIESDALWTEGSKVEDAIREAYSTRDAVTANDGGRQIMGGFLGLKATPSLIEVLDNYVTNEETRKQIDESCHMSMNQFMAIVLNRAKSTKAYLDTCRFAAGRWFKQDTYRVKCPRPWVLQNNYIKGNHNKESRAKAYGQWFLDETGMRCAAPVIRNQGIPENAKIRYRRGTGNSAEDYIQRILESL